MIVDIFLHLDNIFVVFGRGSGGIGELSQETLPKRSELVWRVKLLL